jgi:histone H3/H4
MADLLKASGVKKKIKEQGLRAGKDAIAQLERKLAAVLDAAIQAAKADNRSTLRAEDVV